MVGFCYGGGIANMLATRLPDLGGGGAVLRQPAGRRRTCRRSRRRCCIHYAENDERINAGLAGVRGGAEGRATCRYTVHMYPGTQHGFNNDTTPRYDEAAAKLAWQRTIEFFNKHLRT